MRIVTSSAKETKKIAAQLAKKISRRKVGTPTEASGLNARVVALVGDLGAGKTTFAQGFAKALGIRHRIVSPTFLIFRNYELGIMNYEFFYHVDFYRIHSPKELDVLGFKSILHSPLNIVLIEWAEKIKKLLPKNTIWVKFEHGKKENERLIDVH